MISPAAVANRSHRHLHRYPVARFPLGEDDDRHGALVAGDHGPMQRAELLAAEPMAVLVDVAEHVVQAPAADHVAGCQPVIRSAALLQKTIRPVPVAHVHAVAQGIEDDVGGGQQFLRMTWRCPRTFGIRKPHSAAGGACRSARHRTAPQATTGTWSRKIGLDWSTP